MKNKILLAQAYAAKAKMLLENSRITPSILQHARMLSRRALHIISKEDTTQASIYLAYKVVLETHRFVLHKVKQKEMARQCRTKLKMQYYDKCRSDPFNR